MCNAGKVKHVLDRIQTESPSPTEGIVSQIGFANKKCKPVGTSTKKCVVCLE